MNKNTEIKKENNSEDVEIIEKLRRSFSAERRWK
jgi:hypothetical protein